MKTVATVAMLVAACAPSSQSSHSPSPDGAAEAQGHLAALLNRISEFNTESAAEWSYTDISVVDCVLRYKLWSRLPPRSEAIPLDAVAPESIEPYRWGTMTSKPPTSAVRATRWRVRFKGVERAAPTTGEVAQSGGHLHRTQEWSLRFMAGSDARQVAEALRNAVTLCSV